MDPTIVACGHPVIGSWKDVAYGVTQPAFRKMLSIPEAYYLRSGRRLTIADFMTATD